MPDETRALTEAERVVCIGRKCVSRFPREECSPVCGAKLVLAYTAIADGALLPECARSPVTGNRYGDMLAVQGLVEGRWPTSITDAGRRALARATGETG